MTRINLVPPEELNDQHLFAEFREIKMVPKSLLRSLQAEIRKAHARDKYTQAEAEETALRWVLHRIPREYVLGAGHVSFFYDKGGYLRKRYEIIRAELRYRGVAFNEASELDPDCVFYVNERLRKDYTPTSAALELIRERIASRVAMKPSWYRNTRTAKGVAELDAIANQQSSLCACCGEPE